MDSMYVTPEHYIANCNDALVSQDEPPKVLKDMECSIDHLCLGRIKRKGYSSLPSYQQELIKRTVCLRAGYIRQYGPYINSPLEGYNAGSTKVKMANVTYGGISTTQEIVSLLEDTGLRCLTL